MRIVYLMIVFLIALCPSLRAQSDTLIGVLRDARDKVVKRHEIVLGKANPVKVKTDGNGIFRIPGANLRDTLYIYIKKEKRMVEVPVNGYDVVNVTLRQGSVSPDYRPEPDPYLAEVLLREQNRPIRSNILRRSDIEKTRCIDMACLLGRISGLQVNGTSVLIRGGVNSINSGVTPLLVVDGVPHEDISMLWSVRVESIEEMEIVKNGTFYGARGANGVIVIKTAK